MLNMNSPVVQNLMQSQQGFNPYTTNGYIPQQQPTYQSQAYGYNPYLVNINQGYIEPEFQLYYDPMPNTIVNESRGIRAGDFQQSQQQNSYYYGSYQNNNGYYNDSAFYGYTNPILQRNQMEANRIHQKEEAIAQGKIWRMLFKNAISEDDGYTIDDVVNRVESMYYQEPVDPYKDMPIKRRIIIENNEKIAQVDARADYYRQNNIPMPNLMNAMKNRVYNYYNHINSIIGDPEKCDMSDYFGRVYGEIKVEQMEWEAERQRKNLKNKFKNNDFNKLIDKESADKSDSYYYKLMSDLADSNKPVTLTNGDGLTMTADEMEIKLPERLIKNRQDRYYEERSKFYQSIFKKG